MYIDGGSLAIYPNSDNTITIGKKIDEFFRKYLESLDAKISELEKEFSEL